ncbi:MAG: GtrA family protein [Selenomonadaceae bacterium]|nr:GtrA family protein [Selenomonadaceae bacterium]MBR1580752.1 GtrA family protein [Selenomonadaceae bacterium]
MRTEVIRFLIAGGSCFVLELATLWTLTEFVGINYLTSAGLAFVLAVAINYEMCVRWVWSSARSGSKVATLFLLTSVMGLGINQLSMFLLVERVGLHYMVAKIMATALVTVWNFFTKRLAVKQ